MHPDAPLPRVGPLALLALADLSRLTAAGDEEGVRAWIREYSLRDRRREQQVLAGLGVMVARKMAEPTSHAYLLHVEDADEIDAVGLMCGRLVTATLNGDVASVDALVAACMGWPTEERVDVLTELVMRARQPD